MAGVELFECLVAAELEAEIPFLTCEIIEVDRLS
jgi:hypothetical protein